MSHPRKQAVILILVTFLTSLCVAILANRLILPVPFANNLSSILVLASLGVVLLLFVLRFATFVSKRIDRVIEGLIEHLMTKGGTDHDR